MKPIWDLLMTACVEQYHQLPLHHLQLGRSGRYTGAVAYALCRQLQQSSHFVSAVPGSPDESDELVKGVRNNKNLGVTDQCLMLFGNGDGGGGPTPAMLEKVC